MAVAVTLGWELLEERFSLWCGSCFLPTRYELDCVMLFYGRPEYIFTCAGCVECGARSTA